MFLFLNLKNFLYLRREIQKLEKTNKKPAQSCPYDAFSVFTTAKDRKLWVQVLLNLKWKTSSDL